MKTTTATGVVVSGEGKASQFVEISWAKSQIVERLGFKPYPGTLNVRLSRTEANRLKPILRKSEGILIVPATGFYSATCFHTVIMNKTRGAIIIPHTPNYPPNVLEIIAPINLRSALSLKDGDLVELSIMLDADSRG
jgi:riboflavin kinase